MNSNYTDAKLKQALAKMLPLILDIEVKQQMIKMGQEFHSLVWKNRKGFPEVKEEALLYLCALVENSLNINLLAQYADVLDYICVPIHICPLTHWQSVAMATWQQRTIALAKVKGVEIV